MGQNQRWTPNIFSNRHMRFDFGQEILGIVPDVVRDDMDGPHQDAGHSHQTQIVTPRSRQPHPSHMHPAQLTRQLDEEN